MPLLLLGAVTGSGVDGRGNLPPLHLSLLGVETGHGWCQAGREAPDPGVWGELLWVPSQAILELMPGVLLWPKQGPFPAPSGAGGQDAGAILQVTAQVTDLGNPTPPVGGCFLLLFWQEPEQG